MTSADLPAVGGLAPSGAAGSEHRPAIDVARILALVLVVVGHLMMAVVDRDAAGTVRGANLLDLAPQWRWLGALAPMPVFFAAAGWANAGTTLRSAARRLDSVVGIGAVVVVSWSTAVVVTSLVGGDEDLIGAGARIATQPLWFLAAYIPLVAIGGLAGRVTRRHGLRPMVAALVLLAALDVAAFGVGLPDALGWIRWAGFFLAWGTLWLFGAWWRARDEGPGINERRVGLVLVVVGVAGAVALVTWAGYGVSLIDTGSEARSNTDPPGLYTVVAGIVQIGILMLFASALDRLGRLGREGWKRAAAAAVGVYAWHLSALALCVGLLALGVPVAERLTVGWWMSRPLWWAAVLGLTAGLVVLTAAVGQELERQHWSRPRGTTPRLVLGVAAATAGASLVGLYGPGSVTLAWPCAGLFVAGWWLLRVEPSSV